MAADAPSLAEALAGGFLTCSVCLERFRQPRILPCLHTFCGECLETLAGGRAELRCPECRQRVPLPAGVGGLQSNFLVNGLLDLVRPAGEAAPACSLCPLVGREAGRAAASRCLDCADSLCRLCAEGHRCSRLTHAHRVVDLSGYLSGQYDEEVRERRASRCQEHAGEELRFFCTPCAAALCRECRLDAHLAHPCLPLAEAAEVRRPRIAGLLAGVEETVTRMAACRASLEEETRQLRAHEARVRAQVERACATAVQRLLAHQETVLDQLGAYVQEKAAAAEALRSELASREQVASGTAAFARKVLSLGREAEVVSLERVVSERLRQLRDVSWEPFACRPPRLEAAPDWPGSSSLFRLEFGQEEPLGRPEPAGGGTPLAGEAARGEVPGQAQPPEEETRSPAGAAAATPAAKGPGGPPLPPRPLFSCSFWAKIPSDKKRPQVTGLCPFGPSELLVADEKNRKLKRFTLQGEFKGTVPLPSDVAPFSVAAVGSKVAFTAGSRLFLLNGEGGLLWQKALALGQASHAVAALGSERLAVSVAGHLEVYGLQGQLVEKVVPGGSPERSLVFVASRKGGFVGSDWYRRSVVLLSRTGELVAELREEQLSQCQPGAVCADATGTVFVVLRELNKVLAVSKDGEILGPFLTAENSIDRPRVATVAGGGRFVVALSNGTVHVFKTRYQSQWAASGAGGGVALEGALQAPRDPSPERWLMRQD